MLETLLENSDKLDGAPTWIIVLVCLILLARAARHGWRELVDFIRTEFQTNARISELERRNDDFDRRISRLEARDS